MSAGMSTGMAMHTAQRLEMALSPQMIQSMELLQMPVMQLEQRIREEQLENPTLEMEDLDSQDADDLPESPDARAEAAAYEDGADAVNAQNSAANEYDPDIDVYPDNDAVVGLERVDDVDYNWDDVYDDYAPARGAPVDDEEAFDPIANAPARPPSLVEHLTRQLFENPMPDRIRRLAVGMAHKLDANGWLTTPLPDTVPEEEAPASEAELEDALAELQKLDPDGVGARGLAECLLLQLDVRPGDHDVARAIVRSHLEDLAANRLPKIAKALKCDIEEVKAGAETIRTLTPYPGGDYASEPVMAVKPELVVEGDAEEGFRVALTSGVQPRVSDFFIALYDHSRRGRIVRERLEKDPAQGEAFRQFREQMRRTGLGRKFREKYNNAQWLVKAVAQREKTILAVASAIVRRQEDYLAERSAAPAPLFMQDIADEVGYDISTVSRAVKDKYIDTPLGIKPLKQFFTRASGGGQGAGGEAASNAGVMLKIRDMLENEDKRRPLRDNEIMARLAEEGIHIKRRSIVNYREKLGFPSHSHRKEH